MLSYIKNQIKVLNFFIWSSNKIRLAFERHSLHQLQGKTSGVVSFRMGGISNRESKAKGPLNSALSIDEKNFVIAVLTNIIKILSITY